MQTITTTLAAITPKQVKSLQRGVRSALISGVATSITANIIHALVHHPTTAATWQLYSSMGMATVAPVFLFASTEMVTRIPIHSRLLGGARLVITLILASFAGWISYWHMASVASLLGETGSAPYLYPLIIDGMMVVATISLIELGRLARTVTTFVEATTAAEQAAAEQAAAEKAAADKAAADKAAADKAAADAAAAQAAAQAAARAARLAENTRTQRLAAQAAAQTALLAARAEAMYDAMTPGEKAAWTVRYNKAVAMSASAAPVSPGYPPVSAPTVAETMAAAA